MSRVRIFVATAGNEFMLDIARAFHEGFTMAGATCDIAADRLPSHDAADVIQFVVAPHEYFPLFAAARLNNSQLLATLEAVHLINVEQPGSPWFELAWEYGRYAKGVFDINRQGVAELRRRGLPAHFAPLGYASSFAAPVCPATEDRPIDVLFMGHSSPRREEFFARHADFFSAVNCRILLVDVAKPRKSDTAGYASGSARTELVASSKIFLNVHSRERTYFEAHRALLALANRCLLVTEASRFTEPLQSQRDFAMASLDELPSVCKGYLDDIPVLRQTAARGHALATTELTMARTCRAMLATVASPTRAEGMRSLRPQATPAEDQAKARDAVMARLADARARRARGERCWQVIANAAYGRSERPTVSVVVTLHNYARFIESCLASVARSEAVAGGIEIVVVDDASTDDSVEVARNALDAIEIPALLAVKHLNTGLADSRNVGLEIARGDLVFMLDADNWIYPGCLAALQAELANGRYAATYGLLQRFDDETGEPLGLLSMYEWSPSDLVREPYIDAMALFDRQAVLDAGGYAAELIEHGWFGWEDYDLWLTLAQAGHQCKLVPRIVGAYRVHSSSMLQRTNKSTEGIARHFHQKFRKLVERHPGLDRYFGFPASSAHANPVDAIVTEETEIERLRRHSRQLELQLADVYASKSWRITAPLRLALRLLTGRP
jgi:GT2 family glycosyltransferase